MIGFSNLSAPSPFSALPPGISHEASPKTISERTSYLQVRLEFLRYPQVIAGLFNERAFGPPLRFTSTSACSWIGHLVSGSMHATYRAINTRSRCGSATELLNLAAYIRSPDRSTKSTTLHFDVLCVLVSTGFQVLFHSPPGVLFTFPSQYYYTIGHRVIFRLGGWSPRLPTGFLVSRGTLDPAALYLISPTGLSPSPVCFPTHFGYLLK